MKIRTLALALTVSTLTISVLAPTAATAASCGSAEEVRAAQLRQFHYRLQVATLNCRADDPSLPGKWGDYVHHHGGTMSENAKVMRGYFSRTGAGAAAFDRFNTVLTNRESITVHQTEGYCEMNASLFDRATRANAAQLTALAGEVVGRPTDIAPCTEQRMASADTSKPVRKGRKAE